jgi:serine/threonine-protein kinase
MNVVNGAGHQTPVVASGAARYELVDTIASGGMARVYLGRARRRAGAADATPVAVKLLHPHLAQDPDAVALFLDEARVATRIRHPNVVEVRDVDMVGEDLVIIMEYIEGVALSSMIRVLRDRGSAIPVPVVVRVLVDALRGLHAAHELTGDDGGPMHIVHRDVSPHNVLVGVDGTSRVTDFGVATSVGRLAQTRTDGGVRGKLQYLAPEQIHRKKPDRRVDVWAAGLVLWECLTGQRLFDAGTEAETIAETLRAPIPPPSALRPEVPLGLDDVCLRALERDPKRRFATAAEFADALERHSEILPADDAQVAAVVHHVDGEAIAKRRDAFERGPTAPVVLPARFAFALVPHEPNGPSASMVPAVRAPSPAPSPPRSNKLALVCVAFVSLVIGGVGVRCAGARPESDVTAAAAAAMTAAATPATALTSGATSTAATATTPSDEYVDASVVMEIPASVPPAAGGRAGSGARVSHPPDRKKPAARGSSSSGSRPFMPADL